MSHLGIMFLEYIKISYVRILWVFLFACVLFVLLGLLQRKRFIVLKQKGMKGNLMNIALCLTFAFIFVMTLFGRTPGSFGFHVIPFRSYFIAYNENSTELFLQCIMNIFMYIPFGFLLPCSFGFFEKTGRVFVATVLYSVCVELIQGIAQIGYFEVDDTLNNLIGTLLGVLVYKCVVKMKKVTF